MKKKAKRSAKTFPIQLNREDYFKCPVWYADEPDFVEDLKQSDAKQFRGKSEKKKKEMAVAAYLAKQND